MAAFARILVAVDGSEASDRGLDEAIRIALADRAAVRVVHVIDELTFSAARGLYATSGDTVDEWLRSVGGEIVRRAQDRVARAGLGVESALVDELDRPMPETIAREARTWHADLLVLGTHGRRGLGRLLLGSGAERIAHAAPIPVLLVRAPEEEDLPSGLRD